MKETLESVLLSGSCSQRSRCTIIHDKTDDLFYCTFSDVLSYNLKLST